MLDQLTTIPTDAGAGFLAGVAAEVKQDEIKGHPFLFNPVTDKLHDLAQFLPAPMRKPRACSFETIASFVAYVNRFKRLESSIYVRGSAFVAEIDHPAADDLTWGDHTASIALAPSEALATWKANNKKPLTQEQFAELLEQCALDIVTPQAAEILEIVQELHVTKSSSVTSSIRSSGKQTLSFNSEQAVRGNKYAYVEVPTSFEIRIEPFKGHEMTCEIRAFLRVRLREDHPVFVFDFHKFEERVDEALNEIVETVRLQTELPVYR